MTARFDYASFAALALDMIAAAGVEVVWKKPARQSDGVDPWRDQRTGDDIPFTPFIAFFSPLDLSRGRGQFAMFSAGTDITSYTEVGLLAGDCGFVPETTDTLLRDGEVCEIVEIDKISPAGVPVLYFVAVK